jgi:hypothetical protein
MDSKLSGLYNSHLQGKSLTHDVFVMPPIDFVGSHVV